MSKLTSKWVLFFWLNFIYSINILILAQFENSFVDKLCKNNFNYTKNSSFQTNLDRALANLPFSYSGYGFFNSTSGSKPDTANAIGLCRGDYADPVLCRSCVNNSIVKLRQVCPNQKDGIVYYDHCMVRYSGDDILGKTEIKDNITQCSATNVTDEAVGFNADLLKLMDNLTVEAASGESLRKYATGTMNHPPYALTTYGLAQCTPDLSSQQCSDCLKGAVSQIVRLCFGKIGMKVLLPMCNIRYEDYQFYNTAPVIPQPLPPPPASGTTRTSKQHMAVITAATVVVIVGVVMIFFFIKKLKQRKKRKSNVNVDNFLKNHEFLAPNKYSYSQVKKMTNSFKVKLGQGGFGSVYRGELSNGNLVAVKVLNELKGNGEDFINEVASVGRTSHVNIVTLVGFCCDGNRRALIYEFMPNGSLEKFIYGQECYGNIQLGWEKLHQIAIGIAQGLEYLHKDCNTRILHFDIKPHNILLDQDFCPKISDFGLAKLLREKRSMISVSHMRGTPGYIAPELFSRNFGQVSHKSDVYSYGMMLLEMVGVRKNIEVEVDHKSEIYFPHWIHKKIEVDEEQLGLHGIVSDEENEMVRKMIVVGLWCIQTNPSNRPAITKVLEMLEGDLASLEIPPKPYLSFPARSTDLPSSDKSNLNCSLTKSATL